MKSGMKPSAISRPCATGGGTAHGSVTPAARVTSTTAHQTALVPSSSAAAAKPSLCGAVNNRDNCQRVCITGTVGPCPAPRLDLR